MTDAWEEDGILTDTELAEDARVGAETLQELLGYLQVDAANVPARTVYQRLGFSDGYAYHYRMPAGVED